MTDRHTAAVRLWRARRPRTGGDRAYLVYAAVLGVLVVGPSLGQALGMLIASPTTARVLTHAHAAPMASLGVLAIVVGALLLGTRQGPAALPPLLVHTFAGSDLPRWLVFRRPLAVAAATLAALGGALSSITAVSVASSGRIDVPSVVGAGIGGALLGVVTTAAWLIGQVFPRSASGVAAVLAVGIGTSLVAGLLAGPWLTAVSTGPFPDRWPVVLVVGASAALACTCAVPSMLERLDVERLAHQARRWESAVAHAFSLDAAEAAAAFRVLPTSGRRLRAVSRSRRLAVVVLRRDAVAAVRSPGRLATGLTALTLGGVAMAAATSLPDARVPLGTLAGALVHVGLGPVTDGVRHAGQVAADLPLYGIADRHLMVFHAVFPVLVGTVIVASAGLGTSLAFSDADPVTSVAVAGALPTIALGARIGDAVRGPSPLFLLTPAPSALGDPMPAIRVLWALDGPLLAVLGGVALAGAGATWLGACAVAVLVGLVLTVRWVRRR